MRLNGSEMRKVEFRRVDSSVGDPVTIGDFVVQSVYTS
jgi:hypothetical protein